MDPIIPTTPEPPTNGNGNPLNNDSLIWGVSVRAWITIMLVGTLCVLVAADAAVSLWHGADVVFSESFLIAVSLSLGFYFGQKPTTPTKS